MTYTYELWINDILVKAKRLGYKPNVITEITKDLDRINKDTDKISFAVKKIKKGE